MHVLNVPEYTLRLHSTLNIENSEKKNRFERSRAWNGNGRLSTYCLIISRFCFRFLKFNKFYLILIFHIKVDLYHFFLLILLHTLYIPRCECLTFECDQQRRKIKDDPNSCVAWDQFAAYVFLYLFTFKCVRLLMRHETRAQTRE